MGGSSALKVALELLHMPTQVRRVRAQSLPEGLIVLLKIVSGDQDATTSAAQAVDRTPEVVHAAAAFFIEQIMLAPDADSYRVLGAGAQASTEELRRNMTLLLKWLHPDLQRAGSRAVFAHRVVSAWSDLKTPERRAAYAARRQSGAPAAKPNARPRRRRHPPGASKSKAMQRLDEGLLIGAAPVGPLERFLVVVRRLLGWPLSPG